MSGVLERGGFGSVSLDAFLLVSISIGATATFPHRDMDLHSLLARDSRHFPEQPGRDL